MLEPERPFLTELRALAISGGPGADEATNALLAMVYWPVVHFLARRLAAPSAQSIAADLAQETLVHVFRGLRACRARSDAQFMSWVLSIARRVAADWLRSPASTAVILTIIEDGEAGSHVPDDRGPAGDRGRALVMDLLSSAYATLPPRLQELLWLRLVRGDEWAEIGRELGTTEAGAKRQYQRVQRRLRGELTRGIAELPPHDQVAAREYMSRLGLDGFC